METPADFPYDMPDPNQELVVTASRDPTAAENYRVQMEAYMREQRAKPKGRAHTPSLEQLYGALIRAGQVRIIRKKGRAPVIKWL